MLCCLFGWGFHDCRVAEWGFPGCIDSLEVLGHGGNQLQAKWLPGLSEAMRVCGSRGVVEPYMW